MRILKTLLIITLYELSKYVTNEIITRRQANDAVDQYPMDYEVSGEVSKELGRKAKLNAYNMGGF